MYTLGDDGSILTRLDSSDIVMPKTKDLIKTEHKKLCEWYVADRKKVLAEAKAALKTKKYDGLSVGWWMGALEAREESLRAALSYDIPIKYLETICNAARAGRINITPKKDGRRTKP